MDRGDLLAIRSTEISVDEDRPAWCRMTGNELASFTKHSKHRSFLVAKGRLGERRGGAAKAASTVVTGVRLVDVKPMTTFPAATAAPAIPPLAVTSIGSWPAAPVDAAGGA